VSGVAVSAKARSSLKADVRLAQQRYLRRVMDETGMKPSQIARAAKLSHTVLTRFLNDLAHGGTLETLTIASIAQATNVPAPPDLLGQAGGGFREPDAEPFDYELAPASDPVARAVRLIIESAENIVPWEVKGRALEHLGWRAGDIMFVDLNGEPQPGDLVCAQAYDFDNMRAETLFRIYEPPFLIAAGPDPASWKPLSLGDRSVAVKGVVISTFRPRTARAA
jgi:transcriptional regulator with XRE-family HTH domain